MNSLTAQPIFFRINSSLSPVHQRMGNWEGSIAVPEAGKKIQIYVSSMILRILDVEN